MRKDVLQTGVHLTPPKWAIGHLSVYATRKIMRTYVQDCMGSNANLLIRCILRFEKRGSPGRIRNIDQPVNSRLLRSEEHTYELQSLMRISYADYCWKKKTKNTNRLKKNKPIKETKKTYV